MAVASRAIGLPSLPKLLPSLGGPCTRSISTGSHSAAASPPSAPPSGPDIGPATWQEHVAACVDALQRHVAPPRRSLHGMFRAAESAEQADAALRLLARVRLENAAYRRQTGNFSSGVCLDAVHACIRAGLLEKALIAVSPNNPFGLTPMLGASHAVMKAAVEAKNRSILLSAFRRAQRAGVAATATTADILLSGLISEGDAKSASQLAEELAKNGLRMKPQLVERLKEAGVSV
eukprot:TRINITY_DN15870_c0_g1_i1.p1 TRINITY_DN15870_c0_g1~~TRINITY_DN15870_c0_g1_i1.p1  ORF type:complete len:263 (+),score=4.62 TRINITY_DN15870_c0_g1_i1:88-789(+)